MRTALALTLVLLAAPAAASAAGPSGSYRLRADAHAAVASFPYRLEIAWADGRLLEAVPVAAEADGVLLAWTATDGAQGWLVVPAAPIDASTLTVDVTDDSGSRSIVLAPSRTAGHGTAAELR